MKEKEQLISRRKFLELSAITGVSVMMPSLFSIGCGGQAQEAVTSSTRANRSAATIDRFIDPLPVPARLAPDTGRYEGQDYYEIHMSEFQQEIHSQLPPTTVWGFEGSTPGPLIEARRDRPVRIKWINDGLPQTHLLKASIDPTLDDMAAMPEVRTVIHLHGGHTLPQYDGLPNAWSTPGAARTGSTFFDGDFIYPNSQQACMLWYHDHAMAITRLNVYAGLSGAYLIRDDIEDSLGLPAGDYEIPLVIQDRDFNDDGSLSYPTRGVTAEHPVWTPMFLGNIPQINGKAYPYLEVEPRRYRLRLLNGSQARTYNLWFDIQGSAHGVHVIGNDGGLLPAAVPVSKLLISPAERFDIIADFSSFAPGTTLTLKNDAAAPFPAGGGAQPQIGELMQIRVSKSLQSEDRTTPAASLALPPLPALSPTAGLASRVINLENIEGATGRLQLQINNRLFRDPVEEQPRDGTTEIWEFVNLTEEAHPLHLHLTQFQILNRQPLDQINYWNAKEAWRAGTSPKPDPNSYVTGPAVAPPPHSAGWKDTALAMPSEILRIVAPFSLPDGASRPASYVYHCHILEHEDNEMMRPFEVV
ncbi:MAG: multicopper oxidase family protein [Thermoleophilia bacterium]